MGKQEGGDAERVVILASADDGEGGNDGDALLPEVGAQSKAVEEMAVGELARRVGMEQILAKDAWSREIDKVPIVGLAGMSEVKLDKLVATQDIA